MRTKDVRNLILTIIILIVGIFILVKIGKGFISNMALPESVPNLMASLDKMSNLIMLGLGVIAIILIPFYLSKRSQEKKSAREKV